MLEKESRKKKEKSLSSKAPIRQAGTVLNASTRELSLLPLWGFQ
jgi:hypothetical protein